MMETIFCENIRSDPLKWFHFIKNYCAKFKNINISRSLNAVKVFSYENMLSVTKVDSQSSQVLQTKLILTTNNKFHL